jgi:hypothetical protein
MLSLNSVERERESESELSEGRGRERQRPRESGRRGGEVTMKRVRTRGMVRD